MIPTAYHMQVPQYKNNKLHINKAMKIWAILFLSSCLILGILFGSYSQTPAKKDIFKVEGPWEYLSQDGLNEIGLNNHDATMPFIRTDNNAYWIYLSEGGATDGKHSNIIRLKTTIQHPLKSSIEKIPVYGIPDANINNYNGWKAWLMNLLPVGNKEWLAVLHFEDQDAGVKELYRMGMAYSSDDAKTFRFLGFTLKTTLPDSIVKQGNCVSAINIAGAGYRRDNEWVYVYFSDMNREDRSDRHIAIARANINELIVNARNGNNTLWHKYYYGKWEEPGLGGHSAAIGTLGEYHTTLMFNTFLKKWIIVNVQNGDINLKISEDPMDFNVPDEKVYQLPDGYRAAYCSILAEQDDITTCGKEFYIYYRIWDSKTKPANYDTQFLKLILN